MTGICVKDCDGPGPLHKQLLAQLMKDGVEVELCGATATVHNWGNDDLLVGVKVNTNAMARMSELAQQGFVTNYGVGLINELTPLLLGLHCKATALFSLRRG